MKDFTKAMAVRRVAQEYAKHTTRDSIIHRMGGEAAMIANGDRFNLPNSFQAHKDLHEALAAKLQQL